MSTRTYLLALVLCSSPAATEAVVISVTTAADGADVTLDGICATADGSCTLRAALQESNWSPEQDVIRLPAGTYHLTLVGPDEDAAATGDLDVTNGVAIIGDGAATTIINAGAPGDPIGHNRVFHVHGPVVVLIEAVTITNGFAQGAGILNDGANLSLVNCVVEDNTGGDLAAAGGILNLAGRLLMTRSTVRRNSAFDAGGILNHDEMRISESTIAHNSTTVTGPIPPEDPVVIGGGILNSGNLEIVNSTISGNFAFNGGSALYNAGIGMVTIHSTTIVNNGGPRDRTDRRDRTDGIRNLGTIVLANTIIANNEPVNCSAAIVPSGGHNLDDDGTCRLGGLGDLRVADAGLGPLQDNGGPTHTHAPRPGSPAVDAGASCPVVDQRGFFRPGDGNGDGTAECDIGSVEGVVVPWYLRLFDLRLDDFLIHLVVGVPRGMYDAATRGDAAFVLRFEVRYRDHNGALIVERKSMPLAQSQLLGFTKQGAALVAVTLKADTQPDPKSPVEVSVVLNRGIEPAPKPPK
jgi:hypothetical protein